MPKRKYKSRRTYINARRRKEYNRYRKRYTEIENRLLKQNLTPYDDSPYTYNEYFANKKEVITRKGSENAMRKLLNEQFYKFSYEQAIKLKKNATLRGIEEIKDLKINEIRTGTDFDLEFLSVINDELKITNPKWSGKDRAKYIREEWFGYAS